jgi:hypothetical protein
LTKDITGLEGSRIDISNTDGKYIRRTRRKGIYADGYI